MQPQVQAASLTRYVEVARSVGLDPYRMLRRAGIKPESLAVPEDPIAVVPVVMLLEDSARESGCAVFGLLMAESRSLATIGAVNLLLKHQPTARDVIEAAVRYRRVMGEAISIAVEDIGETTVIRTELPAGLEARQATELLMGLTCRAISEIVGGRWHPESAHFVHDAPADLAVHRRVFQCRLVFASSYNGLACPTAWLDAPNPSADSVMARHAERYLATLVTEPADGSIAERARRSLHLLLPSGRGTLEEVGGNLGVHPRALQRLLEKEGRTFATLVNEVRRELAVRYLSSSTHPIAAVAQMIGYASPSSFTRWFCAEFGMAPAAWRAEERQG
jgi:AraC-like DNA-binding protein